MNSELDFRFVIISISRKLALITDMNAWIIELHIHDCVSFLDHSKQTQNYNDGQKGFPGISDWISDFRISDFRLLTVIFLGFRGSQSNIYMYICRYICIIYIYIYIYTIYISDIYIYISKRWRKRA